MNVKDILVKAAALALIAAIFIPVAILNVAALAERCRNMKKRIQEAR